MSDTITPPTAATPVLRAAAWMSGAIFSFTAMAVAGRAVSVELDTFELMFYRSLTGIVIVFAVAGWLGTLREINKDHFRLHLFRNIAHFTGQKQWLYAITQIPLAQVFALEFTVPIWVMIFAALFLGERLTAMRVMTVLLGFCGIMLVARPDVDGVSTGILAAAASAIGFAATTILTKRLTAVATTTTILFYLVTMQAAFGLICAGIDGDIALPTAQTAPWLILIGSAGLLAHFCITRALKIAPAMIVAPIDFARLPIIAIVGMALYNEPLEWLALLGAVVIFGANYLNILSEKKKV